jgi:hypothetical protein
MGESQAGCAFLCAIAVAMGVGSQQSQAPPAFKAGVELVQVDLTVLDRYCMPVGDLAPVSKVRASGAMASQSRTRQYELDRQLADPTGPDGRPNHHERQRAR